MKGSVPPCIAAHILLLSCLQAGLSADELLLQATRAWNIAVRERPQDEELWLEFAAFQHSAAQQQQQRGRCVLYDVNRHLAYHTLARASALTVLL